MRIPILLLLCFQSLFATAQIDTVLLNVQASHLFPSFPIKSSYTSLFDRRPGMDYIYSANMEHGLGIYDISQQGVISPVINLPVSTFNNLDVSTVEQKEIRFLLVLAIIKSQPTLHPDWQYLIFLIL
ncbi:MAG: hypothetical protein IPP34_16775 [Bacteroidetes bacterium]|nr:hypothetical protein [Bacteroidota bacterium]